jgi:hypothetical protein
MLRNVGDRRNVLDKIGRSPAARERLNMVLGRDRAQELEAMVRVEGVMDLARGAVQGNSTTARQLVELGLAGGEYYSEAGWSFDPKAVTHALLTYGLARGQRKIDERVVNRVAELLTSNDIGAIDRGIKLIARNPTMLNGLRKADMALALAGRSVAGAAARRLSRGGDEGDTLSPGVGQQ